MNHKLLTLLSISGLTIIVFIFFVFYIQPIPLPEIETPIEVGTLTEPTVTFVNPQRGAQEPVVQIIEYSDFECSACKTISPALEVAIATYPDQVSHVWKNLPNEALHPLATPAAIAALCADQQGAFWEYHDELFNRQSYLSDDQFNQIATTIGLDMKDFIDCNDNRDTLPIVKKDYEEAIGLGLTSTPTLFVGNQILIGAVSTQTLLDTIAEQLDT